MVKKGQNCVHVPYACHYKLRFVYFLPTLWSPKMFVQGAFFLKILALFLIKSGLWWPRIWLSLNVTIFEKRMSVFCRHTYLPCPIMSNFAWDSYLPKSPSSFMDIPLLNVVGMSIEKMWRNDEMTKFWNIM